VTWPVHGSSIALVILLLIPLLGSFVVFSLREEQAKLAKQVTFGVSLAALIYTVVLLFDFDTHSKHRLQFFGTWTWIKAFGAHLAFGVDGIALVLLFMAVVLVPAVVLASWNALDSRAGAEEAIQPTKRRSVRTYFGLLLLLEFFMIGVFTAADVFLFYVFFEAMLVPMYFIIGSFGGPRRQYAAMKFFLYSLIGGLLCSPR
jgi:NADH-quinone oxidoreductase subunit M